MPIFAARRGTPSVELLDATGVTAIVVTHDREDAHDFADEVAVMDAGRVARIGPTAELYAERR